MALESSLISEYFDRCFQIADSDHDGKINGRDAVVFFQRSGLPVQVLGMKDNNQLDVQKARQIMIGVGESIGAPRLAGVDAPPGVVVDLTPVYKPPQKTQQQTSGGYNQGQQQQQQGGLPPVQQSDITKYQTMFRQTDRDGDGRAQGGECFTLFMNWGLGRDVLKNIWALVAGNQGFLNQQQFVSALYLMDLAKKGTPLPQQLPQGQFPPIAQDQGSQGYAAPDLPNIPGKKEYQASQRQAQKSEVPNFDALLLDQLTVNERNKLMGEKEEAVQKEEKFQEMEVQRVDNREMMEFYNKALQELVLFKSKTDSQIYNLQERCEREKNEAEGAKRRYELVYKGADEKFRETEGLRDELKKRTEMRIEFETKLRLLYQEIRDLENLTPEENMRKQKDLEGLIERVKKAEAHRAKLVTQEASRKRLKESLEEKLRNFEDNRDDVEFEVKELRRKVRELKERLQDSIRGGFVDDIKMLANETNQVYRSIYQTANQVGINIQQPNIKDLQADGGQQFGQENMYEMEDIDFNFEDAGYIMVDNLPSDQETDMHFSLDNNQGQQSFSNQMNPQYSPPENQFQQNGYTQPQVQQNLPYQQPNLNATPPQLSPQPQQQVQPQFNDQGFGFDTPQNQQFKQQPQMPPQAQPQSQPQSQPQNFNLLNTQNPDQGFNNTFASQYAQNKPQSLSIPEPQSQFNDFNSFATPTPSQPPPAQQKPPQMQGQSQNDLFKQTAQQNNQSMQFSSNLSNPNSSGQISQSNLGMNQYGNQSLNFTPSQNQSPQNFGFDNDSASKPQPSPLPPQNIGLSPRQPGQLRIASNNYQTQKTGGGLQGTLQPSNTYVSQRTGGNIPQQPRLRIDSGSNILPSPGKGFSYRDNGNERERPAFGSKNKLQTSNVNQSMPQFGSSKNMQSVGSNGQDTQQGFGGDQGMGEQGDYGASMSRSQQGSMPQQFQNPNSQYSAQSSVKGFGNQQQNANTSQQKQSRLKKMLSIQKNK